MKKVTIFVSHRIDLDSVTIDNPLYVPVRCGSVFDTRNNIEMLGDNIGDNISEKRETFCELTVQYWAWKNQNADYYGLCHYRRFLSFSDNKATKNEYGHLLSPYLSVSAQKKFGLLDEERMVQKIRECDILISSPGITDNVNTPKGKKKNVYEHWGAYDGVFIERKTLDILLEIIDELAPKFSKSAREYYGNNKIWGFNCYVMNKEAFEELCDFQFPILFELENRIDMTGYNQTMKRTPGFMSEVLLGIFAYHYLNNEQKYKFDFLPIVYFCETKKIGKTKEIFLQVKGMVNILFWTCLNHLLPVGTKRREIVKKIRRKKQ